MASVLRVVATHRVGASRVFSHPTWDPDSAVRSGALTAGAILRVARMSRSEVAHFHLSERGSFVREGALVGLARRRGLVTVVTIHGAKFVPFARRRPALAAAVLRRAHLVTCLDPEVAALVAELAPAVAVEMVPNPVAMDEAAGSAAETEEVVLFAGEIGYRKGADVLLQAWPSIAGARPEARCVMVGPRTDLAVPEAERLEVRGAVGAPEMRRLLRSARVIVLPSRAEAMPMALSEAMGAGRPFVATPVGGIPELAQEGGLLVDVDDPDDLAARLTELLADPALAARVGECGRRFCGETRSVHAVDALLRRHYAAAVAHV
jgi:glycosyltransferase involved in cell wall biosynthesis